MRTLSVCIATYERPELLAEALQAIAAQSEPPDEVVVSDASSPARSAEAVVQAFRETATETAVRYVRTERRALPWQRWWAYTHSTGEVVLFIDDDIRLAPKALARIAEVYAVAAVRPAGVGLLMHSEGEARPTRDRGELRERWLGTRSYPSGAVTPGGVTVSLADSVPRGPVLEVEWLCGGAMSFPREVLDAIGPLEALYGLYDLGIGKAEDSVLTRMAAAHGPLLLLTDPLAFHPPDGAALATANAHVGWRRGLRDTLGRAQSMRWLARDRRALCGAWLRVASLEVLRAVAGAARAPLAEVAWLRIMGAFLGTVRGALAWRRFADSPAAGQRTGSTQPVPARPADAWRARG